MKGKAHKKCRQCQHSLAAHINEIRCMLCACSIEKASSTQQTLGFRSSIPVRSRNDGRRRSE